jgi:replication-associated recombination protein RarA
MTKEVVAAITMTKLKTPFSEMLRPQQLVDLSQPERVIDRLQRMVETRSLMNMLLHGELGTGKTSAARILINMLGPDDSNPILLSAVRVGKDISIDRCSLPRC